MTNLAILGLLGLYGIKLPESVDLDGTNDYLSRTSDFTGNTDGKTFTMSFWVYFGGDAIKEMIYSNDNLGFHVYKNAQVLFVYALDGTYILQASGATTAQYLPTHTYTNIILSVDMANTANRHVYVNDQTYTMTWTTYVDSPILFTNSNPIIGGLVAGTNRLFGRLSHVFLDYTYRDLSIEANRRLFITEDGKPAAPAGLIALAPILYCPMTSPEDWFVNPGTGGDMTANGTVALSGRGPNQDNCVASEFDGVGDDLRRTTGITGASVSKVVTMSFNVKPFETSEILNILTGTTARFQVFTSGGGDADRIYIIGYNSSGVKILEITTYPTTCIWLDKNSSVQLSIDMSDSNKLRLIVDGISVAFSILTFTDDTIDFSVSNWVSGSRTIGANWEKRVLGELWFDTLYTDILVNNFFYNSATNKPIPVRQVIENTGVTPLIALPIRADSAGENFGSAEDFTVTSGPFIGARGASEFWSRSIVVDGSNYLTGSIYCESLVKWTSADGITWTPTYSNAETVTNIGNGTNDGYVSYYWGTSEDINWSLEENLLRVTDGLGFPVDMDSVLRENPLSVLALDFSDTADFGANKTGADFTETGTITAGADVTA